MAFHKTLTAVDISDNMLGLFSDKQGYLALSYLLQYSKQLCWLSIAHNPLTPTAARALKGSLASNRSLTSLDASNCGVSSEQWLNFSSSSAENASPTNANDKANKTRPPGLLHVLKC
jgi:Ran GTPase-activating protein (RanGAP) involved in mRNA processing and transport